MPHAMHTHACRHDVYIDVGITEFAVQTHTAYDNKQMLAENIQCCISKLACISISLISARGADVFCIVPV